MQDDQNRGMESLEEEIDCAGKRGEFEIGMTR